MSDEKQYLVQYLGEGRDALRLKTEGLDDYDVRRPLVPSGTNVLGLLKHVAACTAEYFGVVFDRPFPGDLPLDDDPLVDLWVPADESRADVLDLYDRAWAHADATIEALDLDSPGHVPWWPGDRGAVTLGRVLIHMTAEVHRHAGHADLVRELIDGSTGLRSVGDNMPDDTDWPAHVARVEQAARTHRSGTGS